MRSQVGWTDGGASGTAAWEMLGACVVARSAQNSETDLYDVGMRSTPNLLQQFYLAHRLHPYPFVAATASYELDRDVAARTEAGGAAAHDLARLSPSPCVNDAEATLPNNAITGENLVIPNVVPSSRTLDPRRRSEHSLFERQWVEYSIIL